MLSKKEKKKKKKNKRKKKEVSNGMPIIETGGGGGRVGRAGRRNFHTVPEFPDSKDRHVTRLVKHLFNHAIYS
jgi:preprotein translocase subunit YajC